MFTLRALGYDKAGRILHETNALGGVTHYGHYQDTANQRVYAVTNADQGVSLQTFFRDGQPAAITGTATFPERFEYGLVTDASTQRLYVKNIKLESDGSDSSQSTQSYQDSLGRTYKTTHAGSGSPTSQTFYNEKGQRWKEVDPDGVVSLLGMNARGELAYTAIDSNRNDMIDTNGLDRITQVTNDVVSAHGTQVRRTRQFVWDTYGSGTPALLRQTETSVDGLTTGEEVDGAVTVTERTLPSGGTHLHFSSRRAG